MRTERKIIFFALVLALGVFLLGSRVEDWVRAFFRSESPPPAWLWILDNGWRVLVSLAVAAFGVGCALAVVRLKRTRDELRAALFFRQELIDRIPVPIFHKDADGVYRGCNKAFERMLNRTHDELVGKTVFDIAPKELAEVYHAKDRELLDAGGTQVYEGCVKPPTDGDPLRFVFHKATISHADGAPAGLVGVMLDITEIRRVEARNLALVAQVNEALDQIKQLRGLLPICSNCKKIRDDGGAWNQLEAYICEHSEVEFTHGICPECARHLYPGYDSPPCDM